MGINYTELENVVHNAPVDPGDTISHVTVRALCDQGLAHQNCAGQYWPTERGRVILDAHIWRFFL